MTFFNVFSSFILHTDTIHAVVRQGALTFLIDMVSK